MKILLSILTTLGVILVLPVVAGFFLPRGFEIVEQVEIAGAQDEIFPYINTLKQRKAWSPFQNPETQNQFEGPESGVGAKMIFDGGVIEITESNPPESVTYITHFDDGYPTSTSHFTFEEVAKDKTKVLWKFTGQVPDDFHRRFDILSIEGETGAKHLKGLQKLKEAVEKK